MPFLDTGSVFLSQEVCSCHWNNFYFSLIMSERRDGHLLSSLAIYLEYLHFHLMFTVPSCITLPYLGTLWVCFVFKENSAKFWIIQANSLVYSVVS